MLIVALACLASDAVAQSLTLAYQQVVTRSMPGATAALSLDPSRVTASAHNGEVTLVARGPGVTNVIVVFGDHTESLEVRVGEPPLIVLPGMRGVGAQNGTIGHYELQYASDPGMLQGSVRLARREGDRSTELALGGATPVGGVRVSPLSIPLASFTIATPDRELTLMDRQVANSPLTIARSNVRGLHLRQGRWRAHAGYSFFGNFEHLLLPTIRESVAGIGYRHEITPHSSLTPNVYYFGVEPSSGRSGLLGTLQYAGQPTTDVKLTAELAISRSVGGALEIDMDRPNRRGWLKLLIAPQELPSLSTDHQRGRHLEGGWIGTGDRSSVTATMSSRSNQQGAFDYTSHVANVDLQRSLTQAWNVHGGSGYSIFENGSPVGSKVHSLMLPVGTSFSRKHVGLGVDYQFSRETTRNLAGHLVRASFNGGARDFRFSLYGERQTQAPSVRQILSEVTWLQPMLDRLGLAANTPEQLADLLRTNAELSAFGYANSIQIDVTPVRTRFGASGGWSGSGSFRPQLVASTLFNRDQLIDRTSSSAVHSLSYTQRLGDFTELSFTWSALCRNQVFWSASCRPVMAVSLRRTLNGAPGLLMSHRGEIEGTVFRDDRAQGRYEPGLPTIAGVEVLLDGERRTRTDRAGRFRFGNVPYGRHRVEARYESDQPTYFTTPSPAYVDAGATADFGIALARSNIRGVIRTDAGKGLGGVLVRIAGADRQTTTQSSDDGSFLAEGLDAGEYEVSIDRGTVPAGYPIGNLAAQRVRVEGARPGHVTFVLTPYRSVSGRARTFNRASGQYEVLAGATLELQPLGWQSVTDAKGLYSFRDLPSGEYSIVVKGNGREHSTAVSIPEGPAFVKDLDVAIVPVGDQPRRSTERHASAAQPTPLSAVETTAAAASTRFTIEVTTSTNVRHARAMVDELKGAGHAAYLVRPASGASGPYHVRIGHYPTLREANELAFTLEKTLGWRLSVTAILPAHVGDVAYGR